MGRLCGRKRYTIQTTQQHKHIPFHFIESNHLKLHEEETESDFEKKSKMSSCPSPQTVNSYASSLHLVQRPKLYTLNRDHLSHYQAIFKSSSNINSQLSITGIQGSECRDVQESEHLRQTS
jgi:hypothetical protein